jgi:hypothetical protein
MGTTTNGLPYPASTDAPNGPTAIQALAAAVDAWGSWNDYTPTLVWTNTTATTAKWNKQGKVVTVEFLLTLTGVPAGTFSMTLPSTAAAATGKTALGTCFFLDTSATTNNQTAQVVLLTSTTFTIYATQDATAGIVTATNPITLASGDTIGGTLTYREA